MISIQITYRGAELAIHDDGYRAIIYFSIDNQVFNWIFKQGQVYCGDPPMTTWDLKQLVDQVNRIAHGPKGFDI